MNLAQAATQPETLGNTIRLAIYRTLVRAGHAGLPVGQVQERLGIAASTLSHHLQRLISTGLVTQERHATSLFCRTVYPAGHELVDAYLKPLAAIPTVAAVVEAGGRVTAIGRRGIDKMVSKTRETRPFVLAATDERGPVRLDLTSEVIETSETWTNPNSTGANGLPVPDVLGRDRGVYAGKTTLVVRGGNSAANVLLDLARLAEGTVILLATHGSDLSRLHGGGVNDNLTVRVARGSNLRAPVESGLIRLTNRFGVTGFKADGAKLSVEDETGCGPRAFGPLDTLLAITGQRPDPARTGDLRFGLNPWLESARALGPRISPRRHSCVTVCPHDYRELVHPEPGFYTAGINGYGRAPKFLMMTGYEQLSSIVAALDGDLTAADAMQLKLPETRAFFGPRRADGSCSEPAADAQASSCCGRAA